MAGKYSQPEPIANSGRSWPDRRLNRAPIWCSVDLRDGNQSLPNPMGIERKLEYFRMLCDLGFKEIEVSFPSSSLTDFNFTRRLIEENLIPEDVSIMGLTPCRENLAQRTMDSFKGVRRAIVHAYIATSDLHVNNVFHSSRKEVLDKAVKTAQMIRQISDTYPESDIRFEFSPEEFSDTDICFSLEICTAVFESWDKACPEKKMIINLPATVERRLPNEYADMVEIFSKNFSYRDKIIISLHAHNDQGMAVAACELGLLAGAQRVEGVLFGHGERSGNSCLVTLANNLRFRGLDVGLDFSNLEKISKRVEELTGLPISPRHPYAGELVCCAFSGSHQDAIRKTMPKSPFNGQWKVSYLHFDPADLGRKYEDLIRINSQSGKGGVAWVLNKEYGLDVPNPMLGAIGQMAKSLSDSLGRELNSLELYDEFRRCFMDSSCPISLGNFRIWSDEQDVSITNVEFVLEKDGQTTRLSGSGNGPVSAFVEALSRFEMGFSFSFADFYEQSIGSGEKALALAYVCLCVEEKFSYWGAAGDANIAVAAAKAVLSALNHRLKQV